MNNFSILKFGGTSVGSASRIKCLYEIVTGLSKTKKLIVVCSAVSGITDLLFAASHAATISENDMRQHLKQIKSKHFEIINELFQGRSRVEISKSVNKLLGDIEKLLTGVCYTNELSPRTSDAITGFGEQLSCTIIAAYFNHCKTSAKYCDARKFVVTDDKYGEAQVDFKVTDENIKAYFKETNTVYVVTGFIGSSTTGISTTLGRGGSDYTASIIGGALQAREIQIWTDVSGVYTADPRKVPEAFPIDKLSYIEALEMCYFGAKVIHPPTIQPALNRNIPLFIKNTMRPEDAGTFISLDSGDRSHYVKGITSIDKVHVVTLQGSGMIGVAGVAVRVFGALAANHISVILITQGSSEHNITFAVKPEVSTIAKKVIEDTFKFELRLGLLDPVHITRELSIVAIIGENMKNTPGVSGRLFQALGKNGISVIATAQGSSELNISVVIKNEHLDKALNTLHQAFFLSQHKIVHLYCIGTGLIGKQLLDQISKNKKFLLDKHAIELRLCGIANSRKMFFDKYLIKLSQALHLLDNEGEPMNLKRFVKRMHELNLSNSVFVDCTANEDVTEVYHNILENSISIVTPNKIANSGSYVKYNLIKQAAKNHNVKYLYETNVGAGLPIISVLRDLILSGDRIVKIEAVLSGTLSFIFNTFDGTIPFSEIVKLAKEKGYTEPDPRDDLSCKDFARKLLILARDAGQAIELDDISISPLLPAACMKAKTVDDFFEVLKQYNSHFSKLASSANKAGEKLRAIGTFENGKAFIQITQVSSDSPFYNMSGTDNLIAFTTQRYAHQPLVVKGPGAGAEVTAAGVFAEIISISNYLV